MSIETNVGRHFKVFHSEQRSNFLMISAHGAHGFNSFTVPSWTQLHFYAPGKHVLVQDKKDFHLGISLAEAPTPSGAICKNYMLSKYQDYHGGSENNRETYAGIGRKVDRFKILKEQDLRDTRAGTDKGTLNEIKRRANHGQPVNLKELLKNQKKIIKEHENTIQFDILTVRNRLKVGDYNLAVTLHGALKALAKNNMKYEYIFCSFCRSRLFHDDPDYKAGSLSEGQPSWPGARGRT